MTKTKKLAINAMLSAMCAVLSYLSLDLGNIKLTFEGLPILAAALLLGGWSGGAVGLIGILISQLLRYGLTVTTLLWILPHVVCGLTVGFYAQKKGFALSPGQAIGIVTVGELLVTALNSLALYVDSKLFGYYTPTIITGVLALRTALAVARSAAYGALLPPLLDRLRKIL